MRKNTDYILILFEDSNEATWEQVNIPPFEGFEPTDETTEDSIGNKGKSSV